MIERAFQNSDRRYWLWLAFLLGVVGIGCCFYLRQLSEGFTVTGLSRDVSWGLYIGQFTFFVGVAASAVVVVLPYYLHDVKVFGKVTMLGEFLAVGAVSMCLLFILVDMGMPSRVMNVLLYATPTSPIFWDMVVLNGYLMLNLLAGWKMLESEYTGAPVSKWVKPLVYLSIPWAISIHTVTAFLYAGLPGREYWLTALTAPKFLASAFATGPALLIILCFLLKRLTGFDVGREAVSRLTITVTYSLLITLFMVAVEFFTAFYSQSPGHMVALQYLFFGIHGHTAYVALLWLFILFSVAATALLLNRRTRENNATLCAACTLIFIAMLIEKGIAFVIGGFMNNPFHRIAEYAPTFTEAGVTAGIWAVGALIISLLYKVAVFVKSENRYEGGMKIQHQHEMRG